MAFPHPLARIQGNGRSVQFVPYKIFRRIALQTSVSRQILSIITLALRYVNC